MTSGQRRSTLWFSLGVALTTATQLRVGPLGPGEVVLLGWILVTLAVTVARGGVVSSPTSRVVTAFWAGALALLLLGAVGGLLRGFGLQQVLRDLAAFAVVSAAMVLFALQPALAERSRRALALIASFIVLPLLLLILLGGRLGFTTVEVWYGGVRLSGWAANPNQLALALAPLPMVAFYLYRTAGRRPARRAFLGLALLSVALGVLTLSDGLAAAWLVTAVGIAAYAWYRAFAGRTTYWRKVLAAAWLPILAGITLVLAGKPAFTAMADTAEVVYDDLGQASIRLALWRNGLRALEVSPLVGNGPGAFSGVRGPFSGGEAHSTPIDWAASTGLTGLMIYLGILLWAAARCIRLRNPELFFALVALFGFSLTHYVLRHPLFWIYVVAAAVLPGVALVRPRTRAAAGLAVGAPAPASTAPPPAGS